jgi:hypothetical protein
MRRLADYPVLPFSRPLVGPGLPPDRHKPLVGFKFDGDIGLGYT